VCGRAKDHTDRRRGEKKKRNDKNEEEKVRRPNDLHTVSFSASTPDYTRSRLLVQKPISQQCRTSV
jgi:hypothetical protein